MEFLDINLTRDSGLLFHAIHRSLLLADFTENQTLTREGILGHQFQIIDRRLVSFAPCYS
jgi:hypothetical protein